MKSIPFNFVPAQNVLAQKNDSNLFEEMIKNIQKNVMETYVDSTVPWIVTYSGGKDSSVVLDMVLKTAQKHRNGQRICIVSNNTLVESPLVINHLKQTHKIIDEFIKKEHLNISVHLTHPPLNNSFWVNLIGKGYPTPNQMFRWCTSRLKIDPTSAFIEDKFANSEIIMTVGTREAESTSRKKTIKKYASSDFFSQHSTRKGCTIFMPIRFLTDEDIWEYLSTHSPPWGGDYRNLINLYREAYGGECPVVTDSSALKQVSCGERSPRFGCWTCTLVKDDSSLQGLVDSGYTELAPLYKFRNWLVKTRNGEKEPYDNRLPYDRKGKTRYNRGRLSFGPYTISFRKQILKKLLALQAETGMELITETEVRIIHEIWDEDSILVRMYKGCQIILDQKEPEKKITCEASV